ncbi:MAG: SHOCT domain-containing protein [Candidatus Izimaplasma sp.]|nr:SHOCT domain-containing protein [Candidatus Izimaplasma bacterium]
MNKTWLYILGFITIIYFGVMFFFSGIGPGMMMHHYSPYWYSSTDSTLYILYYTGAVILIILFIVAFVRYRSKTSNNQSSVIETLKKRLAEGDIDQEEYQRLKSILTNESEVI